MISLTVVLALHAAVLFGLGHTRTTPPAEPSTLFVNLIAPPADKPAPAAAPPTHSNPPLKHQNLSRPATSASPVVLSKPLPAVAPAVMSTPAAAPVTAAPEAAASRPNAASNAAVAPTTLAAPAQAAMATGHTAGAGSPAANATDESALSTDLAVTCPDRPPADYPMLSRRLNESGTVVLRVEVDERGTVATASVERSSGFTRLDAAALAAIRTWHCHAPTHNGQPVRATALQPFHFRLED